MSINLVSGYAGEPHVTSDDVASLWASIVGEEDFVFDHGHNFSCSMISTNVARIFGGDALLQGKHVRQADSEYTDVSIDNGTSGTYRKDLIVLRWTKDSSTSVESCALAVVKGTEAATAAAAVEPSLTQESIPSGGTTYEMPLWQIPIEGISVGTPVCKYATCGGLMALQEGVDTGDSALISQVATLRSLINSHFVQAGTRVDGVAWTAGYISNNGKDILFNVVPTKPLAPGISNVEVVGMYAKIRQNNKYLWGDASNRNPVDPEEVRAYKALYGVNVIWSHGSALTGATNNAPVGLDVEIRLKFT